MKTRVFRESVCAAGQILRDGGLVAGPTETVYGLAGNALDEDAVRRIYEVKGRPEVKPLSMMVPDAGAMERWCVSVPKAAGLLAERFSLRLYPLMLAVMLLIIVVMTESLNRRKKAD